MAATDRHNATPIMIKMADVQSEPVRWLWPNRIPLGKVTMLAGGPIGKSCLALDIAARVSSGASWPDDPAGVNDSGSVVLVSTDDLHEIRLRLEVAGADVDRISCVKRDGHFDTTTLAVALDQFIVERMSDCRLIVVDPVTDSLEPLADLARRRRVAVLAITPSPEFPSAARVAWSLVEDSEDRSRRLLQCVKNNLAAEPPELAFRLTSPEAGGVALVEWEGA